MIMISGTKPSTPPTPAMIPETTSERKSPSGMAASAVLPSQAKAPCTSSMGSFPALKVRM